MGTRGARCLVMGLAIGVFGPPSAHAAAAGGLEALDGARMAWPWALPFLGILLTIATGPLLFPRFWHHHYGKLAAAWAALTVALLAWRFSPAAAFDAFIHVMLEEYLSFIILLFALFTVAGGVLVTGALRGTPLANTLVLALGTVMASFVGTTGAAMILIRPLIRANEARPHNVHVVVFFIFLVANIGGALTPLGDPPLFVGFLHGVDFFWTTRHLLAPTVVVAGLVLATFTVTDLYWHRRERNAHGPMEPSQSRAIQVRGKINLLLIALIIATILGAASWQPGISYNFRAITFELQNLVRDGALVLIAALSVWLTPDEHRAANEFSWEPIKEVAKLFAGIFVCIIPVLAMLKAGERGAFAWLLDLVTAHDGMPHEVAYFWLTGILSAFLDNAPTYLVFFELAGGDAQELMGTLAPTLAAISMGAVYMGALTYIGNAPNLMVYAIAEDRGIKMPSFFGYLGWAAGLLLPVFALVTFVFVRQP
jgi:Na+/H+ antiporter NhaD/arsenite permease-like protein